MRASTRSPARATVNAPKAAPAETLVVNAQSAHAKSPVWMKVARQTPQPHPLKQQTTPTATDRRAKAVGEVARQVGAVQAGVQDAALAGQGGQQHTYQYAVSQIVSKNYHKHSNNHHQAGAFRISGQIPY